jgi:hypothetical protein
MLTNRTACCDTAMPGEISVRGLRAAGGRHQREGRRPRRRHSAGAQPQGLRGEPEAARNAPRFLWAERVEDVIEVALEPIPQPSPAAAA